jgi:hypothetical protein
MRPTFLKVSGRKAVMPFRSRDATKTPDMVRFYLAVQLCKANKHTIVLLH